MSDDTYRTSSDEPSQLDFYAQEIIREPKREARRLKRAHQLLNATPSPPRVPKLEWMSSPVNTPRPSASDANHKIHLNFETYGMLDSQIGSQEWYDRLMGGYNTQVLSFDDLLKIFENLREYCTTIEAARDQAVFDHQESLEELRKEKEELYELKRVVASAGARLLDVARGKGRCL